MCVNVVGTCYGIACGCFECSVSRVMGVSGGVGVHVGFCWRAGAVLVKTENTQDWKMQSEQHSLLGDLDLTVLSH